MRCYVKVFGILYCLFPVIALGQTMQPSLGLMLGSGGMSSEKRVQLARQLGVAWLRPSAVFIDRWNGQMPLDCEVASKAGLKLALTVRNCGGRGEGSVPPANMDEYAQQLGEIVDACRPALLVVENEENSNLFYKGTPEDYFQQLKVACGVAHSRNVRCSNGGLVSKLVAFITYHQYLDAGDSRKAEEFARLAFDERTIKLKDSSKAQKQLARGRALLALYKKAGADYVNIHWYIPNALAFRQAVEQIKAMSELPVITNEIGQHDVDPEIVDVLLQEARSLQIPLVIWYSIDSPQAKALINENGSLRPNGEQFLKTSSVFK